MLLLDDEITHGILLIHLARSNDKMILCDFLFEFRVFHNTQSENTLIYAFIHNTRGSSNQSVCLFLFILHRVFFPFIFSIFFLHSFFFILSIFFLQSSRFQ